MRALLFSLLLCLSFAAAPLHAAAQSSPPARQEDLQQLQNQVQTLDKDFAVFKEVTNSKLDAQDKRIGDQGQTSGNYLSGIANTTSYLGTLITLIAFIGGFAAYISAKDQATKQAKETATEEAQRATKEWVQENEQDLNDRYAALQAKTNELEQEIAELRKQAQQAQQDIQRERDKVSQLAANALNEIDDTQEKVAAAGNKVLSQISDKNGKPQASTDPEAIVTINTANQKLEEKPEKDFTSGDYYIRGLNEFTANRFDSALLNFEKALNLITPESGSKEIHARIMLAQAVTLGQLGRNEEEIAAYEEIQRRYSEDSSPDLCERVTTSLFNKGVTLGQLKRHEEAIAAYEEVQRRYGKDSNPAVREQVTKSLVNKGITLGQVGRNEEAITVFEEVQRCYGKDSNPNVREQVAKSLVNKGVALGLLGRNEDEIATYEEVQRRYGEDSSPDLRKQVARALNGITYRKILKAKLNMLAQTDYLDLLNQALLDLKRAEGQCAEADRAMILGNIGYALFLSGEPTQAETPTRECLRLEGEERLQGQREDARQHRVEPIDSEYEKLLDRLWDELHPKA